MTFEMRISRVVAVLNSRRWFSIPPLLAGLFWGVSLTAEETPLSLREAMPAETFAAAGLEKLSDEELAALEAWVAGRMVENAPATTSGEPLPEGDDAFGLEMIPERIAPLLARDSGSIETRIVGKFNGWRRKGQIFNLENGQVWRQAEAGEFYISSREDPEVMIIRGLFGAYYLQVDGYSTRVRVTRVK